MKTVFTQLSKIFLMSALALGFSVWALPAQAAGSLDAYKYVTAICADGNPLPLWSKNQKEELIYAFENFQDGLYDSLIDTKTLIQRVAKDPYTAEMKDLLEDDGFIQGLHDCFPDSQTKRDLLAIRIISSGSGSYTLGVGIGLFGGLKLFSYAAKIVGSTSVASLRYLGLTEKAIAGFVKAAKVMGYVLIGTGAAVTVYPDVETAITRYSIAKEGERNRDENIADLHDLQDLNKQILLLMEVARPYEYSKLQSQLTRVNQMIQQRISMI